MRIIEETAKAEHFPAWHYAAITIGSERRVVAIFHSQTPAGPVPFWYDDPENPQRALPLLMSMSPENLGDYGEYLKRDENMRVFVAICKAIQDLPDPLFAIQAIEWVKARNIFSETNQRMVALQAMNAVEIAAQRRRRHFDQVISALILDKNPSDLVSPRGGIAKSA